MHRSGHLGAALLAAAPVVFAINLIAESASAGVMFAVVALVTGRIPDVDQDIPGVKHRGVTHTIVFIAAISVLGGAIVASLVDGLPAAVTLSDTPTWAAFLYGATAVFVGGVSHLLTDAITEGSGDYAIHPFWPVSRAPLRFDMSVLPGISKNPKTGASLWNGGFVVLGLVAQGAVYSASQSLLLS